MNLRAFICVIVALPMIAMAPAQAQVADPRVAQLEEQVRRLSGLVEELNFQVLQMQDQMRRMQEDNEFRFQELQGGSSGAPRPAADGQQGSLEPPAGTPAPTQDLAQGQAPALGQPGADLGTPPRDFGTITFDANGNPVGASVDDTAIAPAPGGAPMSADDTVVAALPSGTDEASVLYRNSYELVLSGDYAAAETGFRDYIARFPGTENEPDARFWLGESQLAQDRYREAAETFLSASRDFPQSRLAPEMLYKLGVSLSEMQQREVACATFAEVAKRYPNASAALMERVRQEQALASC